MHKTTTVAKTTETQSQKILEMKNITKAFLGGKVIANDNVTLKLKKGEVLSIVGENGSGKSTLMNILFGMYKQDAGQIFYNGKEVDMYSSGAAAKYGIGMVHQHFHLIDKFTVLDNILLGQEKVEVDQERLAKAKADKIEFSKLLKHYKAAMDAEDVKSFEEVLKKDAQITKSIKEYNKLHLERSKKFNNEKFVAKTTIKLQEHKNLRKKLRKEIKELLSNGNVYQANKVFIRIEKAKNTIATAQTVRAGLLNRKAAIRRFNQIKERYGLDLEWDQRIVDLSVGQRQKVEIMKVLWVSKNIVVFDEPTATLSVKEIEGFLSLIELLKERGVSIIFISHKLAEVKQVSNRVVVLNKGKFMGSYKNDKTLTVKKIANLMVGADVELKYPQRILSTKKALEIKKLSLKDKRLNKKLLDNVSFDVKEGEVFGLAGIEGNGQEQILEVISGLTKQDSGIVKFRGKEIQKLSVLERNKFISHVPTDRFKYGIIPMADLAFNSFITSLNDPKYVKPYTLDIKIGKWNLGKLGIETTKQSGVVEHTNTIIERLNVEGAYSHTIPIKDLSGGNQQKFVIGRELEKQHEIMLAGHPTRGLDIKAINNIYTNIIDNAKGKVTLLFSLEITELLAVCDRLAVFHEGKIMEIIKPSDKKAVARLPLLMVGERS